MRVNGDSLGAARHLAVLVRVMDRCQLATNLFVRFRFEARHFGRMINERHRAGREFNFILARAAG